MSVLFGKELISICHRKKHVLENILVAQTLSEIELLYKL